MCVSLWCILYVHIFMSCHAMCKRPISIAYLLICFKTTHIRLGYTSFHLSCILNVSNKFLSKYVYLSMFLLFPQTFRVHDPIIYPPFTFSPMSQSFRNQHQRSHELPCRPLESFSCSCSVIVYRYVSISSNMFSKYQ